MLFTSESCNLQCSYCDMANHINKKLHAEETKKVKNSLINGQYLNTLQKTFERLEIDPGQMLHFELWGQEPTITLKEFSIMFPQLYNYCYNLQSMMFSTNGVGFIDDIINFIVLVDNTVKQNFNITIQFSFDGYENTKNHRGINPDIIINNIIDFLTKLNNISLKLTNIIIQCHYVVDDATINKYADEINQKELFYYLRDFSDLSDKFMILNKNNKVTINPFSPGLINPYNASVQDGKNLAQFYKNCEKTGEIIPHKTWRGLTYQFFEKIIELDFEKVKDFIYSIGFDKPIDTEMLKILSEKINCGFNYSGVKVRYDGKLIICQNAIMGLSSKELKDRQDSDSIIQSRKLFHNFYPNILTDNDEIIDEYLRQIKLEHEETFFIAYSQVASLMSLLLYSNQIDSKYNNKEEFLKCAYNLTTMLNCAYNGIMQTGSMYGKHIGYLRFFCNGFMDILNEEYEKYKRGQYEGY